MRRMWMRACAFLMVWAILITTTDLSAFAAENYEDLQYQMETVSSGDSVSDGNSVSVGDSSVINSGDWDETTTEWVWEAEDYRVNFLLASCWDGGYNVAVRIDNLGENTIDNWCLSCEFDNVITNIWDAEVYCYEDNAYILKNVGWNADIVSGGSVEFGFGGNESFKGFPESCSLQGQAVEKDAEDYSIEYYLENDWGSGFVGHIAITNNTDSVLEDWRLEFDYTRTITSCWNGVLESVQDNHYVIKNTDYNANIEAGQTVTIGFTGQDGVTEDKPYNYLLYSYEVENTEYVQLEDGKIDKVYLEQAIYPYLLLQGLPTDNVKLSDDYDKDKLSLAEEYEYDTNPFLADTDEDGLSDYDEIHIYGTNPIKYDTDWDDMGDGTEIDCGLNPCEKDSDWDGIFDSEELTTQNVRLDSMIEYKLQEVETLPTVQITGCGDYSRQLYAVAVQDNRTVLDVDCLVGTPFEFVHDDAMTFEESRLSFSISDTVLEQYALEDLAIAWFNEEENALELLDTTYDSNSKTISTEVSHYSIYLVVSVPDYFYNIDWENESSIIEAGKADVIFAIDTTGSMGDEIRNVRNNIQEFVSDLEENKVDIRLGLIEYKDIYLDGAHTTKNYGWYTNVADFKEQVSNLGINGGGGDGPESSVDALECARKMDFRTGVKRYIILLTDAQCKSGVVDDSTMTLERETEKLAEDNIVVSVVTTSSYSSIYEELPEKTDGILANINQNFATALTPLIEKMGEQVNSGCWVRLSDGSVVELEKDPSLRDETVDTDKDGIPDIFELNDIYTIRVYNPYTQSIQKIDTWSYFSNPAKVDTDGDGLIDIEDIRPNVYDVIPVEETDSYIVFNTGRTWYNISCTAYDYLDNLFQFADGHVDNAIPIEEYRGIVQNVLNNSNQSFGIEELIYISFRNPNGAPLYMHDETEAVRETVFQSVSGRESRYYQHTGTLWEENWCEVPKGTESGFFKGTVLSEADISYSWKLYTVCDVYSVLTTLSKIGALVMVVLLVVEVTPVVVANVSALTNYIKLYGVTEGIKVYLKIGVSGLPDGLMSALQMEVPDGGGTPGGDELPGEEALKADIDKYLEKIVDASGSINTEKMDDIRLAIQKGTFSTEDISAISKRMSDLGITKEYEMAMKSMDFGTYLKNISGEPPADMINPHAHHILFKTGNGLAQQALVEEGQAILRSYGIDPIVGPENLVWAPNAITGQHNYSALEKVVNGLKELDGVGEYDDIVNFLKDMGQIASSRK